MINDNEPIDTDVINDVYTAIDKVKDRLVHLLWRNNKGNDPKTLRSNDGKALTVLAGVVKVETKTSKQDEVSIQVKFFKAFGGGGDPTVVAMPESSSPYGVSVKSVDSEGFTLVIHQFPDNGKDDKFNLSSIHYIAVGKA